MNKVKSFIRKEVRKINEQQLRSHKLGYDLSKSNTSVTHWLEDHLKEIENKKIYQDKEKLIEVIKSMKSDGVHVSPEYLDKVINTIKKINQPQKILQFLYDIYLAGSALSAPK